MKYFETKYEKDSARITMLLTVILILLIFIVGPTYLDPPEEYGVAVNFGTTDFGRGDIQPKEPIKSETKEVIEQPKVQEEESKPDASTPQETKEEVLTEDNPESIAMKKQKEVERKKEIEDAKAKAEAERVEREKKAQEEKRKKLDDLIGGIGKTDGKETGGEGNDNKAGDKGQLDGGPYAASYFGEPGTGGGGSGYGLRGRGKAKKMVFKPDCNVKSGIVIVEIHVDRNGNVVKAISGVKGTFADLCLYEAAEKTALSHKWSPDSKAPQIQKGFIVYNLNKDQ